MLQHLQPFWGSLCSPSIMAPVTGECSLFALHSPHLWCTCMIGNTFASASATFFWDSLCSLSVMGQWTADCSLLALHPPTVWRTCMVIHSRGSSRVSMQATCNIFEHRIFCWLLRLPVLRADPHAHMGKPVPSLLRDGGNPEHNTQWEAHNLYLPPLQWCW